MPGSGQDAPAAVRVTVNPGSASSPAGSPSYRLYLREFMLVVGSLPARGGPIYRVPTGGMSY